MATPIKQVPILTGELAEAFVRQAEANERRPHGKLPKERESEIKRVMREMEDFVPSWRHNA
ncbi:MAG: hypothetical protein NC187_07740 [Candidatus Amulumruptor caecigallinarius]|nr:hypothetical protein [Candidatus Amulumruptor caecigallinarius]MCM1397361.1 hypothetical protein [Candidatus Amulumruptor caecigallinarius]MCM1453576.1 hypothetical protein [bacterium]